MDSRTQTSNGSTSQLSLRRSTSISITTSTTTRLKISETTVSQRRFTALPTTTRVFSHSLGEESRKLIQLMDSRTQASNGSQSKSKRRETSVTTASLRRSTDLQPTTRVSSQNHGEE
jgi:hypothetical protein